MMTILGLNDDGKKAAKNFLLLYDKRAKEPTYNMALAIDSIELKVCECQLYAPYFELTSYSSINGNPVTIYFSESELITAHVGIY